MAQEKMSEMERENIENTIAAFTEEEWEIVLRKIPYDYLMWEMERRIHRMGSSIKGMRGE